MGLTLREESSTAGSNPGAGKGKILIDSADGMPKLRRPSGAVVSFVATTGTVTKGAQVHVDDYGADPTGTNSSETAITNAIAALGGTGGTVVFGKGTYLTTSQPYVLTGDQIEFRGAGAGATTLKTNNTTGDQLRVTGYGSGVTNLGIQGPGSGTTSNKTAGTGLDVQGTEGYARNITFAYQYDALRLGGNLVDASNIVARYFKANGIVVDHQSDHRITTVLMNNNAATLPTGAGIDVRQTASLILDQLNIIASNFALNLSPANGVTIPSVKATNCFFDTSAVGLNMTGAGSVLRSEFTNCWFSSHSIAGIRMDPTGSGQVDGLTFANCDVYQNVAGTTTGIIAGALVKKWKLIGCNIAGWTTGIALTAGANHFPTIIGNTIGSVSAFGVNATGINVGAGTYKGLVIAENDVVDNTTAFTLGALTIPQSALAGNFRIIDNAGINPRGTVTAPITAFVSGTVYYNNTGFRVLVAVKGATVSAIAVNGVAAVFGTGTAGGIGVPLEPGGTIAVTWATTQPTWVWVGQ